MHNFKDWMAFALERVNLVAGDFLPEVSLPPHQFNESLHYTMGNPGKRLRSALVYMCGNAVHASIEACDYPALAVELIHTYSLVHDDLPAMDDDDIRRSKPACHIAFNEATAILCGDGLQALAFEALSTKTEALSAQTQLHMIQSLSRACGPSGMCKGQALDMEWTKQALDLSQLEHVHRFKTGALIASACQMGAYAGGHHDSPEAKALFEYGQWLGFAFQVQDDILDVSSSTEVLGKPQGSDAELGKTTYPSLLGLEKAKEKAVALSSKAKLALEPLGERAQALHELADYIVDRVA